MSLEFKSQGFKFDSALRRHQPKKPEGFHAEVISELKGMCEQLAEGKLIIQAFSIDRLDNGRQRVVVEVIDV